MNFLQPNSKEIQIVQNNHFKKNEKHQFINYSNSICVKPWGHEFLVYQNEKIGIWFLKMLKNNKTSLHTHFNKDTFIIVLSGCARIELIDNDVISLNTMDYLFIPHYKFHSIGSFSDETLLIEIEVYNSNINFTDKNDLLRIDDIYKRKDDIYQNSISVLRENLEAYNFFTINETDFFKKINNSTLEIIKLNNDRKNILNSKGIIQILLKGRIYENKKYYQEGSIIDSLENYNCLEDDVILLQIKNKFFEEDKKLIYSNEHLKHVVSKLKSENKKIILSSGCFDILHVGHIHNLCEAKSYGDILMVCLSNDEQIKLLKGENRPINKYEDRINLFKTIKYVDYVIIYDETDIEKEYALGEIMKIVDPYLWIKGSDYEVEKIIKKHPYLKGIKLIENVKGKSTTNIINQIYKK